MKYENLFSKGYIGKLEIKNKIVMPAMGTSLASSTGEASDEIIKYYEERAKGGCGLIITEVTRIDDITGIATPNQLSVTDLKFIPRLQKLARAVHRHDTKIFIQLHHPGRETHENMMHGTQIVGPSPVMSVAIGEMPRELTLAEIKGLVKKFVFGAKVAQMSGIDGVEIHAAHGYLIGQFMSPQSNIRTDEYGGDFTKRMRFLTEIIMGIHHVCGNNFPISVRIDGDEFVKGGITLPEAIEEAKYLESLNVNAINVSAGTYESVNTIIEPISYPQGWKKHLSQAIKNSVNIPIIACDVIRKPDFAESLLKDGNLDFVALGRQQLADPEWGTKAMSGREKEIRPCISCLHCIEQLLSCKVASCAVNARMGRELEYNKFEKNGRGRIVAVIGGGPAGMEASRVLALKGFKPVLFEKENSLGGCVNFGSKPPLKDKLNWLVDNMTYQLNQLDIDIRLNSIPSIEDLKKLNPYAVFMATGASSIIPKIPGIKNNLVVTVIDVLSEKVVIKDKNVIVVGSGMTGLETAEFLVANGNTVTVIEMQDKIGPDAYLPNLIDVSTRLRKNGVNLIPSRKLLTIEEDAITAENTATKEIISISTDFLVLSLGIKPNNAMVIELEKNFKLVKVIGDVSKPGRIADAIQSGFEKAYVLE